MLSLMERVTPYRDQMAIRCDLQGLATLLREIQA